MLIDGADLGGLNQTIVFKRAGFPFNFFEGRHELLSLKNWTSAFEFLDKEGSKGDDSYHYSEWGPQATEAMCNEVRDFKLPDGMSGKVHTLGDLTNKTSKELISKVMLEEKVFSTWFNDRVVLLGDGRNTYTEPSRSFAI
ncbi:hypothetical protein BGZ92_011841 [Podila epicladia]|nr:hypothetical protein BGZ92_011841 [Podila epicladia]